MMWRAPGWHWARARGSRWPAEVPPIPTRGAWWANLTVTLKQSGPARLRVVGLSASSADPVLDSVEVQVPVAP